MRFLAVVLALAVSAFGHAQAKQGYIFNSPNTLGLGTSEAMSLILYDIPAAGTITVSLLNSEENNTLSTVTKEIEQPSPSDGQSVVIILSMPATHNEGVAKLRIIGSFKTPEPYEFNKTAIVGLQTFTNNIFIQTDKPIYRPGQTVKFRVLPTDAQLRPLGSKMTADIWIENEGGIRLAQWPGVTFEKTFVEQEMNLSDQPTLGTWTIYVNGTSGDFQTQTFDVQEYVLPKFEVNINNPPFALVSDKNITWKICGRYTYGQLVNGNISIKATYESYSWDRSAAEMPTFRHNGAIEGCYNLTVEQDILGWMNSTYRYRNIQVYAEITEDGTDITRNASTTLSLTNNPLQLSFKSRSYGSQYFKPGLPFHGKLSVTNPDNTPRADELIQLCSVITTESQQSKQTYRLEKTLACKNFTSNKDGIVEFSVAPSPNETTQIKIQADAVNFHQYRHPGEPYNTIYYRPTTYTSLYQWFSPSNSFIEIQPVVGSVPCGVQTNLTVLLTGQTDDVQKLYVQVVARGQIVMQTTLSQVFKDIQKPLSVDDSYIRNEDDKTDESSDKLVGYLNVPLVATADMPPQAHVLIYYVRQDGEIIADSKDIDIAKCLKNDVKMSFTGDNISPGANVGLQIKASPGSLCGISVVDKSVYLLSSGGQLTLDTIFQILQQYDSKSYYWHNSNNCANSGQVRFNPIVVQRRSLNGVAWKPNTAYSTKADASNAFQNGKVVVMTDLTLETKPCDQSTRPYVTRRPGIHAFSSNHKNKISGGAALARPQVVNDVMEISKVGAEMPDSIAATPVFKPLKEVRDDFRETWLWELAATDENGEVLIKKKLPDTITEWRGSAVCINSKQGMGVSPVASVTAFQPFFVSFTLPYSVIRGETTPIIISVFNYVKEPLAIALILDESEDYEFKSESKEVKLCVRPGKSGTETFLVKPETLGKLNFTARAYTVNDASVCGNETVSNVTARDAATNNMLVEPEGFPREETINAFFCPEKDGNLKSSYELKVPDDVVEGSTRVEFSVSGDLMGSSLKNIDNLVQMPTGCGEQNMLNFVPDIFVLEYLTKTGRLTDEINTKLLGYLKQGYQKELTYRHVDSSYSAFGKSDKNGSIWLTAFVVKAYSGAQKYIYVDKSDIKTSAFWITNQQLDDGCFPEIGTIHHGAMKGGVESAKGSAATLTSYITISLLEGQSINETILNKSLSCLALETNPATYTLALMTYATCLANSSAASTNFENLMKKAKSKDGLLYWDDELSNSRSIQIEIASYAILSMLQPCGGVNVTRALPIVRWIAKQRNANGGFVSTQDTVMALQALSAYGTHISKDPVDLVIKMETSDLTETFKVNEKNKLLVQSVKVPTIPTPLDIEGNGTGCGLIQATLKYNVQKPANDVDFTIDVKTVRGVEKSCKKATFTSCISYQEEGKFSNMALLQIRLVSGYSVDQSSLPQLKDDTSLNLKRWDINENTIAFYFDRLGAEKKCFTFILNQDYEVIDTKPGVAKLFDYYQPEKQVSSSFSVDSQCP